MLGVALEGVTRVRFGSHEVEPSSYLRGDGPAGPVTGLLVRAPAYSAEDEAAAGSQALRTDDPDTLDHTLWKGPAPTVPVRVAADASGARWFGGDFRSCSGKFGADWSV